MQVIIKVLKGEDCTLNVETDATILEIKKQIEKILNIPVENQKLLFIGRSLNDQSNLLDYPQIKNGSKLNLIAMRQEVNIREIIYRNFRKHYNDGQSERLSKQFLTDFKNQILKLNLDDLERLANQLEEHKK